ncbi:hypothetical protein MMC12_005543 [Toensbergia leucococca]|nr:hypothetical protein [Toensbergia leucococca]
MHNRTQPHSRPLDIGLLKIRERATTTTNPPNAIASWEEDGEGGTFHLRERQAEDDDDHLLPEDSSIEAGLVHQGGTSAAVWSIGTSAFCKVKAWCEGLEPENDIIHCSLRDQNAPSVPVTEVLYSWLDHDWNRSFPLLKRVPGQTLRKAWPSLSAAQNETVAAQIAGVCSRLAGITSRVFGSAIGCGVLEPLLMVGGCGICSSVVDA